jgi:hypothetical protein
MRASPPVLASVSRPKIHRLPGLPQEPRPSRLVNTVLSYGNTVKLAFTVSSVVLVLIFLVLFASRFFPAALTQDIVATASAGTVTASPLEKTIVLRNENQVIIGQMARISSPIAPSSEVSTMSSDVDKRKGRELLSIINQY